MLANSPLPSDSYRCASDGQGPLGPGTAEASALFARDAITMVRSVRGPEFIGFDVVEVIPAHDPPGQTATLALKLAYEVLSLVAVRGR